MALLDLKAQSLQVSAAQPVDAPDVLTPEEVSYVQATIDEEIVLEDQRTQQTTELRNVLQAMRGFKPDEADVLVQTLNEALSLPPRAVIEKIQTFLSPDLLGQWTRVAPSVLLAKPKSLLSFWKRTEQGLFATKDIDDGSYIGKYTGDPLTTQNLFDNPDIEVKYILWMGQADPAQVVLDGKPTNILNRNGIDGKNLLRYANHSKEEFNMVVANGTPYFFAARDIEKGEELTWKYGDYEFGEPNRIDLS